MLRYCRQIESLVIAMTGWYNISQTFANCFGIRREVVSSCVESRPHLRRGNNVCDWDIPFMPAHTVLRTLHTYRSPWNEDHLVKCFSAVDILSEGQWELSRYQCNEHGICPAISEIPYAVRTKRSGTSHTVRPPMGLHDAEFSDKSDCSREYCEDQAEYAYRTGDSCKRRRIHEIWNDPWGRWPHSDNGRSDGCRYRTHYL